MARAILAAALLVSCGALRLPPQALRARPLRALATETDDAPAPMSDAVDAATGEALSEEELAKIKEREAVDPLMVAAGGDSDFVRWYRFEKAKENYLKENPTDVLANAYEKLKGPVSSLVILLAGFYAIPIVQGISQGVRSGDLVGTLSNNLANPTEVLKFPGAN